nr:hypothetical protein [Streptomyces sp. LBUM 1488]
MALTLRQLFASTGSGVPDGPLVVAPGTVLVSFVVGVVVTMVAAYLPARRAAAVPPVAAMSALHTPPPVRSLRRRNTLGVVLIVLGVLGVVSAASSGEQGRTIVLVPSALLLIGLIVVTPALSGPAIALAGPLLRRFGVPGTLAARNARRNPRRTASTASALMIGACPWSPASRWSRCPPRQHWPGGPRAPSRPTSRSRRGEAATCPRRSTTPWRSPRP